MGKVTCRKQVKNLKEQYWQSVRKLNKLNTEQTPLNRSRKGEFQGFSSKNPSESGAERKFDQIQVAEGGALPPPSKAEQSIVKQTPDEESEEPHSEERIPVYVAYNHPVPTLINVRPGTTVGQLAVACSKLNLDSEPGTHLAVSTAVGSQVSVSSPLHPGAIVIIEELTEVERSNCQAHLPEGIQKIPKFTPSTRQEMLWPAKRVGSI